MIEIIDKIQISQKIEMLANNGNFGPKAKFCAKATF